jgi:hypothetical protein
LQDLQQPGETFDFEDQLLPIIHDLSSSDPAQFVSPQNR